MTLNVSELTFFFSVYPSFTKYPQNISVAAGSTAKLECGTHGEPTPSVAWQKDGGHDFPAARERRMHMRTDLEFLILNASHEDSGVYSCIANNSAGVSIANATLTVLEKPSFARPMEDKKNVIIGGNVVLQCMAGGIPRPSVEWRKDNGPLSNTDRYFFTAENQLLVIVNIVITDAGTYECKLNNGLGTVRGYTQLIILPGKKLNL